MESLRNSLQRAHGEHPRGLEVTVTSGGIPSVVRLDAKRMRLRRVVCRIEYALGENTFFGTGFLVGPEWILTNYHVVEPALKGTLSWSAIVVRFDHDGVTRRALRSLWIRRFLVFVPVHIMRMT
jgi:hypothetical protein